MGDAQSAQREGRKDEGGEEESGKVEDAQTEISTGDKPLKNNEQITEMSEKAGSSIASVNGHCEDEIAADAVLTPDEDALETENPLEAEEKTQITHVKESSNEADVAEDVPMDVMEIDAKKNDINDGFKRFFSNIGLKLSIKRGSTELLNDLPDDTNMEEPSGQEQFEDSAEEIKIEDAEQVTHVNTAQETNGNDSTTCPTLTDGTSEDVLETAEEKATEAKEDVESDNPNEMLDLPVVEDTQQEDTPEHEPNLLTPPDQEELVSPIKRFFTTGIFSGLRKKRKPTEDETNEKEMVDMGKKEAVVMTEETVDDQQVDKDLIDPGVEATAVETEHKENEIQPEIPTETSAETTDEGKPPTTDPSTTIVPESELLNSQEKEKVQASPLKKLLSGSSFKKLSKKPRSRRSSDARLSDSGEHAADQLQVSVESTDNQKEEVSTQPSPEVTAEEDGAWASFKKLLTPKKHTRTPSLSNKDAEIPASVEEPKPSEEQQISDHCTEEGKKRKDSSVSWEAVLCGSGKKRSRKTSDSEEESPQVEDNKQEPGSKNGAELPQVNANDIKNETSVSTPKQSPLMSDAGSTWRTFKRLVTPKRKAKDEEESKDIIQSDGEVSQDESSFSLKKLLPGRKKRKPVEKQDHVSSDEAEKEAPSGDEDSETPAVVPLSEFDTPESVVQIQTQVDIEPNIPNDAPEDLQQQILEPTLPCDSVQNEAKKLEEKDDTLNNKVSKAIPKDEELDDVSEIISKHQQLSDITEEGVITDTMVTPVSIHEEAGRDDTIAEDLIEITSEAITAPEPISVNALADETEMVSAVSQLSSESSKTSGNTTPVPAEYEVKETEALLHQVVETISSSPKAVPISSSTPKSESIVGSVLHQIFRTFVKEDKEATILEIHRKSEATAIKTGQTVEELDDVKELAASTKTESLPEVSDSESTECLSKAPEKLATAEMAANEVHEARLTISEPSIKELLKTDEQENQQQVEYQGEEKTVLSIDFPHEGPSVEESLAQMQKEETPSMEPEETELPREAQIEVQKTGELETDANKTKHVQVTDAAMYVEASGLDSKVVGLPAQEDKPKDKPPTETLQDEAQETVQYLTEVTAEPENRTATVEDVKNEHAQEPEKFDTVRAPELEFEDSGVILKNVPETEVTSDLKEENLPLTAADLETEDASKTELIKEPEVLHTLQKSPLDSIVAGIPLLEEAVSENLPTVEAPALEQESEVTFEQEEELPAKATKTDEDTVKDTEMKETASTDEPLVTEKPDGDSATSLLTEKVAEPLDVSKTGDTQEEQASLLGLLMRRILPHKKVQTEDEPPKDTVTEQPQPTTKVTFEPEEPPVKVVTTENFPESEVLPSAVEERVIETKPEEGLLTEGQDVIEGVDESSATLPPTDSVPVDASKTEDIQQAQELQTLQQSSFDSKVDSLETEVIVDPEEIVKLVKAHEVKEPGVLPPDVEDTVTETKTQGGACIGAPPEVNREGDATVILREGCLEQTDLLTTEQVQEQEKLHTEKVLPFIADESNIIADVQVQLLEQDAPVNTDDVKKPETIASVVQDSLKETSIVEGALILEPEGEDSNIPVTIESLEPMHLSTTELAEVQEELHTLKDSEGDSVCSLEKVLEEDSPSVDTEKPQKETGIKAEAVRTEAVKEPQAQESLLSILMHSLLPHKKAGAEDLPPKETVTEETQPSTEDQNEVKEKLPVEAQTTEYVQEPDLLPSHTEDALVETKTEEYTSPDLDAVIESTEGGTTISLQTESSPEEGASIHMPVKGSATTSTIDSNLETVAAQVQDPGVLQTEQPSLEDSKASGQLTLEKPVSEDIPSIQTVTEEPKKETEMRAEKEEKLTIEVPATSSEVEPEVLLSDVGDIVTKTEEVVSSGMQVVTESAYRESSAIPLTKGREQHIQEPEVKGSLLGLLMRSILPQSKEVSEDLSPKELVRDEPQPKTEVTDEPEEIQFQAATTDDVQESEIFPSGEIDTAKESLTEEGASLQPEVIESLKAEAPPMAKIQEELQTVQASSLESEEGSPLPIEKAKPEVIQTVEVVTEPSVITIDLPANEVKVEPQKETEMEVEFQEKTQVKAVTKEEPRVSMSAKKDIVIGTLVEEGSAIQISAVKESMAEGSETKLSTEESFELMIGSSKTEPNQEPEDLQTEVDSTDGSLPKNRVVSDEIPSNETTEPKQDTKTVEKTAVEDADTECVLKPEVLPSDVGDTVKDTETKEDDMQVDTEGNEAGTEMKPHTEARAEPVEDTQEPQVQQSLLGLLMHSILPIKTTVTEDLPPQEESVTEEPKPKTEMKDELVEEKLPVEAVTAEYEQEMEDAVKDSKTAEVAPSGQHVGTESAEDGIETIFEPVDPSKTEHVQKPEVQESLLGLLMRSILPSKPSSEDLPPEQPVTDEPQPKTEVLVEPKENLLEESETVKDVPELEGLSSGVKDAVKDSKHEEVAPGQIVVMESAEDGKETVTPTVGSAELEDPSKTEQVQQPEVQESLLGLLVRSILPSKPSSEDLPPEEPVTDEPQPKTEVLVEPKENLPEESKTVKDVPEPEGLSSGVKDAVKDSKHEEVAPGQIVVMESAEDGKETVTPTVGSAELEDPSKTEQVQQPEVQESLLGLLVRSILPSKPSSEDLPPEEPVTDEPQPKTEVLVKPKENLPEESETVKDVPEPEGLSSVVEDAVKDSKHEEVAPGQIVVMESAEDGKETVTPTVESAEPVDPSKTEQVQQPEVQESLLGLLVRSILPSKTSSEDLPPEETATDEPQPKTEVVDKLKGKLLEESETAEKVPEPEIQAAVDSTAGGLLQPRVLSDEIPSDETTEPKQDTKTVEKSAVVDADSKCVLKPEVLPSDVGDTVKDTETKEDVPSDVKVDTEGNEAGTEMKPHTEARAEPVEDTQEPQVQQSLLGLLMHSILPIKTTVTEDLPPQEESVTEEPKPKTEMKDELVEEKLLVEAVTAEYEQDVEDAVKDSKTEEVAPSGQHVGTESADDMIETIFEPVDPSKTEHVQQPEVQESLLGLLVRSILPSKTSSEDLPPEQPVTDESQPKTEVDNEPKGNLPEESETVKDVPEPEGLSSGVEDAVKDSKHEEVAPGQIVVMESDEDGKETVIPTVESAELEDPSKTEQVQQPEVQESLLGLLMRSILPSKPSSEDLPPEEPVTDEPQPKTEVVVELKENLPGEAVTAEDIQEPEGTPCDVDNTVKDDKIEEVAPVSQHVVMESSDDGNETITPTEGSAEPVDPSNSKPIKGPEVQESLLGLLMRSILPNKALSEDEPSIETVTDEPQPKTEMEDELKENLPGEAVTAENEQEPELPLAAEGKVEPDKKQSVIDGPGYVEEQEISTTDIKDIVMDIETEEGKLKHHKAESIIVEVQVEQKDSAPEVAEELQPTSQVHSTSVTEESKEPEILGKIISEEIQASVLDNTAIKDESKFEVHLSEVQVSVEGEKESKLSITKVKTAALEHAVVPQVSTCDQTEVSASITEVLLEKTLDITEPLNDEVAVTSEQDGVVQMMPPVEFDDSHKIQEQVADADVKSSEMIVDKELEGVITETKEVIDVSHETGDSLYATLDTEMDLVHEETKTAIQEQHVPDMESKSAVAFEEAAIKQPDIPTDVSELAKPPSNETAYQKVMEDYAETLKERYLEAPAAIGDDPAIAQQVSDNLTLTKDFGLGLNVTMDSCTENLRESESEKAKSEILVTAGDIKLSSEELDGKKVPEPAQTSQIAQATITTTSNTELVVPQNTGIISSVGNVESPTSLSLEFKLNIQFNQGKAQPPQTTERSDSMKKTDVSDVGVQAEEVVEPMNPTQSDEDQKKIEPAAVNAPPKEITAPETLIIFTERAVITTQPVLLDVGVHAIETVELVSQAQASQPQILNSAEATKPADVFEVGVKAIEAVEPVKEIIPTQSSECQKEIETTEADHEHKELLESPDRALITTHPQLLGVGIHLIETVEPVPEGPNSPQPATDGSEPVRRTDVAELGFQEREGDEPAMATIPIEGSESQSQVEVTDFSDKPTEIIESAMVSDSAEEAVVTTQPEILEVVFPSEEEETTKDTETEEVATSDMHMVTENVAEAGATIPPTKDTAELVDPPKTEDVQEPEVKKSLFGLLMRSILPHKKEVSEDLSDKEPHTDEPQKNTEVKDVPEEPTDVGAHAVKTLEPAEKAPGSQLPPTDKTETVDQTDGSQVGVQVMKAIIPSEESQKQVDSTEVSDQRLEITEHVVNLVEGSVILTQPELLNVAMHPVEGAEPEAKPVSLPPLVERSESVKPVDEFEVEVQAMEPLEEPIETAETLKQTDLAEVSDQSKEMPHLDSTESTVLTTQVEVSDVGTPAVDTEEHVASSPPLMEGNEPVEQLDISEHGVKAEEEEVETVAAISPTQRADSPKQIEPTEVNVQQLDVGIHEVNKVIIDPASSLFITDATQPLKRAGVSEVEIQAEEEVEPEKPSASTQNVDSVEQSEQAETNVQATELSEPAVNLDSTERAVIMTQPVVFEIGIQPTRTEEPESNVQTTETIQPESQTAVLDQPVPPVASDRETKAAVNTEEENDQDVWMDAEEGIYTQEETEMLFLEAEEPKGKVEAQSVQEEESGLEEEVELEPKSRIEDEESEQEVYQTGDICEIESEGEDFAIALEPQEYASASVTTLEWD